MVSGVAEADCDDPVALDQWSARKIQPVVVLYVVAVFGAFMLMAHFIFHSAEAVRALLIAAAGAVAATVPGVMERVEYRLTGSGLDKRPHNTKKPRPFQSVFRFDELSRVIPRKHGFKYSKVLDEKSPLRRFWKMHVSDQHSGEVHVEQDDLDRVLGIVQRQRATTSASI